MNKAELQARCQGAGDEKHVNRLLGVIEELYLALQEAETIGDFPEELRSRYELKRFNETLTAKIHTHIYCKNCDSIQPMLQDLMSELGTPTSEATEGDPRTKSSEFHDYSGLDNRP